MANLTNYKQKFHLATGMVPELTGETLWMIGLVAVFLTIKDGDNNCD